MSAPFKLRVIRNSPTQDLWQIAETGEIGQFEELLSRGVDVNASNELGVTALMVAAYYGRLEMVRALINHRADVNLKDSDGFTAAMLADHSGHQDIVRILAARGARGIQNRSASGALSQSTTEAKTFNVSVVGSTSGNQEAKTLHDPPNIWEIVHETHAEFDPRSAFVGHLKSIDPVVVVLIALTIGVGALVGFMKFGEWSGSAANSRSVRTESHEKTTQGAPATAPTDTPSSLQQLPSSQASDSGTTPPSPIAQPTIMSGSTRLAGSVVNPKTKEPGTEVVARPRRQDQRRSITAGSETLAGAPNTNDKDKVQESTTSPPKIGDSVAKPDDVKSVDAIEPKKEEATKDADKAPSPPPVIPPKASPTPKQR